MLVQKGGDGPRVGADAGHVGGGREGADPKGAASVAGQLLGQVSQVDVAVPVLVDGDHVGDRLAPRQLVRMMLEGTDEDDGPFLRRDPGMQAVAAIEVRRDAQVEDADDLVHGRRGSRAAEDDRVRLARRPQRGADEVAGILPEPRRLAARARGLRVRVGVERHDLLADVVLDEGQVAPRGGVVGVRHAAHAEGPGDRHVIADDARPDDGDELLGGGGGRLVWHGSPHRSGRPTRRHPRPIGHHLPECSAFR